MPNREFAYTAADFSLICRLLYQKVGIRLKDGKQDMVYSRLVRRVRALSQTSVQSYLVYLQQHPEEEQEFINALTTNLTSFFRESQHFDLLADYALRRRGKGILRVWCSACSTGEEAYSIAMTLCEALQTNRPNVEIVASDIDSKVLQTAQNAVYALTRLEGITAAQKRRFFDKGKGSNTGYARVKPEIVELIQFCSINLLAGQWPLQGKFDVIFCRNVMIYFDKETQTRVLEKMATMLKPDGLYMAGHSESFLQARHLFANEGQSTYRLIGETG